jgi:hypothetical protein
MAELARRPSATRGASIARIRRRQEALRGNRRSLIHGAFAKVMNAPDVAAEVDLIRVAFPNLDPIADERLVLLLAQTRATVARAFVALGEAEGVRSSPVTAFLSRQSALQERLERALYDRDRERAARLGAGADPLARYRPGGAV